MASRTVCSPRRPCQTGPDPEEEEEREQKQKQNKKLKRERENNNTVSETPAKLSQDFTRWLKQQTTSFLPGPKDQRETVIVHKGSAHPSYTAHPGWRFVSPWGWCGGEERWVGWGGGGKGEGCVIKQHSQLRPESCTRRTKRQESGVGMTSADT